ncbi:MAG: replicative DNA helicase [Clostridia bacterium]|jgi:replicative DNA helicase|nr:replicative DNA helicase [Clostridia bacterium]
MKNTNTMPHNLEAEQSILGCIMIDNELAAEVLSALNEDDFYTESHKYIIAAFKAVYNARQPIDLVTVSDKLEADGKIQDVGGIAYLTELMQVTPSSANYKYYFDIIKRDSINRGLIRAAQEISEYAKDSENARESIQYAEEKLYALSKAQDTSSLVDVRDVGFFDVLDKFNALQNNKDAFRGVMTGFFRLDRLTNGLQKSDLIVIAARPGVGKTSFTMNIVEYAAVYGGKVCAVFSLEMPTVQIKQRLICANANVSMASALSGKLKDPDWKRLAAAQDRLSKSRISIDDCAKITPAEILSKCRRIKSRNGGQLDLVIIDYIQLMSSGRKNDENRTLEVASITRDLKAIAKELQVPIIALSQLKRLKAGEKSSLSDLRESGAIEQDADIVMFIDRNVDAADTMTSSAAELRIAKHRNGECGTLPLRFKGEITKFVDAEKED